MLTEHEDDAYDCEREEQRAKFEGGEGGEERIGIAWADARESEEAEGEAHEEEGERSVQTLIVICGGYLPSSTS